MSQRYVSQIGVSRAKALVSLGKLTEKWPTRTLSCQQEVNQCFHNTCRSEMNVLRESSSMITQPPSHGRVWRGWGDGKRQVSPCCGEIKSPRATNLITPGGLIGYHSYGPLCLHQFLLNSCYDLHIKCPLLFRNVTKTSISRRAGVLCF